MICLLGYNEDPREIWEFRDARRYVRRWARFTGMNDIATSDRWLGRTSAIGRSMSVLGPVAIGGMGFRAACGVFGEMARQMALRGHRPTVPQCPSLAADRFRLRRSSTLSNSPITALNLIGGMGRVPGRSSRLVEQLPHRLLLLARTPVARLQRPRYVRISWNAGPLPRLQTKLAVQFVV